MPSQSNGVFAEAAFTRLASGATLNCSILVVGGSLAAYSATLTALKNNLDVCLVQPQRIVGGQFTTQALPASDDGDRLRQAANTLQLAGEQFAISKAQRNFRERMRSLQPLQGRKVDNPGGSWVSPLSVTPVVAATAMNEAIVPYLDSKKLKLIVEAEAVEVLAETPAGQPRRITGVVFRDRKRSVTFTVKASVVIEATDLGDLLEIGKIESRVGQEARSETGETILPETARPQCQQSITWNAVVEYTSLEHSSPIKAPAGYGRDLWLGAHEFIERFWTKDKRSGWQKWDFFSPFGIFRYRRLARRSPDEKAVLPGDISVINWGTSSAPDRAFCCGNDYRPGRLVGIDPEAKQLHLKRARDRTLAYLYYLQTHGLPNLKLRGDLTWTADGLALEPYIREARRGVALTTIRHEDVALTFFPNQARARCFDDTVGVGQYHYLDLHGNDEPGHVSPTGKNVIALPFTLPLTALVPKATDGLVLSSKSLGTSHITNAAYRMHPVEWAIGEASGFLATYAVWTGLPPREVATQTRHVRTLQGVLARNGIPIFWFDDVAHDDPDFEAIQVMAAAKIVRSESQEDLHFRPHAAVTRAVVCTALANLLQLEQRLPPIPSFWDVRPGGHWAYKMIETLSSHGLVAGVGYGRFAPDAPMTREQFSFLLKKATPDVYEQAFAKTPRDSQVLQRRELSRLLYSVLKHQLESDRSVIPVD
ncbi:MAG: FAD-dependent oxidoreductase [Leptolyngbyaceae cyanobacterium RM1_1_2]|nr:FAD-dependent oxidoreductase [Leptolyngbyaceae cyanobacterium RM1_1_2]